MSVGALGKNSFFARLSVASLMVLTATVGTGCGSGSNKNPLVDGISYNGAFVDGKFVLSVAFKNLVIQGGGRFAIPKMPNSYFELGPDFQSNGTLLAIGLDSNDIKAATGAGWLNPTQLPGGRPLPGVGAGQLPGLALQIPQLANVTLYFGNGAFGAFIPVKLPWDDFIYTHKFYSSGTRVGNISLVGRDTTKANSGILLLINKSQPVVAAALAGNLR